ncbi:MAG: c-type cytochrome [Candidatus Marinimicrobia bacterium]|nr:c-type cytochrome [Candidatus Neomarinimicrobiota bacterium]
MHTAIILAGRATARAIGVAALLAVPVSGQIPDMFVNLKVLPGDIAKADLVNTMKSFTKALGVRCEYCHVGEGDLANFDFPSDKKKHKVKARVMLEMVAAINGDYLPRIKDDDNHMPEVSCMTCHRGKKMPEL